MEIVGYVAYAILLILAITWTIGVRTQLGAGANVILGAVYFVASAVIIPTFDASMLHSLWVIPVGFLFAGIIAPALIINVPVVSFLLRSIAGIFASVIRIGVPHHMVFEAQEAATLAAIDEHLGHQESE